MGTSRANNEPRVSPAVDPLVDGKVREHVANLRDGFHWVALHCLALQVRSTASLFYPFAMKIKNNTEAE